MKLEEINHYHRCENKEQCDCGKEHTILTQEDNFPEYYTDIYVKCDCGNFVFFELPVN